MAWLGIGEADLRLVIVQEFEAREGERRKPYPELAKRQIREVYYSRHSQTYQNNPYNTQDLESMTVQAGRFGQHHLIAARRGASQSPGHLLWKDTPSIPFSAGGKYSLVELPHFRHFSIKEVEGCP